MKKRANKNWLTRTLKIAKIILRSMGTPPLTTLEKTMLKTEVTDGDGTQEQINITV
jgi:hypothetical protein